MVDIDLFPVVFNLGVFEAFQRIDESVYKHLEIIYLKQENHTTLSSYKKSGVKVTIRI